MQYCIDNGWAVSLEFTDDPHPRNTYWEMWGHPMFDNPDAAGCAASCNDAARLTATATSASSRSTPAGWESVRLSFIVNRPAEEPGFRLERQEAGGPHTMRYTTPASLRRRTRPRRKSTAAG